MFREILKILFVFVLLAFPLANCASAQTADLSTDAGVIAELQKTIDAKNAELTKGDKEVEAKQKAASRLKAKDVCIERLKESAKIVVIGFFRTDAGCKFDGAFVDSQFFEETDAALSKIALAALGWEKANRQRREKLATLWVEKVLFAFSARSNQTFYAVSIGDDKTKVTVSLQYPPGVTSRNAPKTFVFDKGGGLPSASGN